MALRIKQPNHIDLASLHDADEERQTPGTTVKHRRGAAGKKPIKGTDRRRKHGDARNRQYATNVTQSIFDLVDKLTHQYDLTKAEFTHRAILHYAEYLKQHGAGEDA